MTCRESSLQVNIKLFGSMKKKEEEKKKKNVYTGRIKSLRVASSHGSSWTCFLLESRVGRGAEACWWNYQ